MSQLLVVTYFLAPGIALLAGGTSPPRAFPKDEIDGLGDVIYIALYPDDVPSLFLCAVLICLPGPVLIWLADYLEEVPFARLPLNTTPAIIWVVLGWVVCGLLAIWAVARAVNS